MAVGRIPAAEAVSRPLWLDRDFGLFLAGHFASVLGDKLQYVALQVFVFRATGRALDVGFLTAAELLPFLALGMLAGAVTDRWGARRALILADVLRAALVAAIPLVFPESLVLLYALILGVAAGNVLTKPGRAGLIKALAPGGRLVQANAAALTAENAAEVLGFLLGGVAAAALSLEAVVYLNAATFLGSAAALAAIRPSRAAPPARAGSPEAPPRTAPSSTLAGLHALRGDPVLWSNTWIFATAILVSGGLVPLVVVYLLRVAGGSAVDLGLTRGAAAAGMILGALAVGALARRYGKGRLIAAGLATAGLATLLLPAVPAVSAAVVALFFVGVGNMLYYIPAEALVQERSAPNIVGRLYGARTAVLYTALLVSSLALPAIADALGVLPVLWASGLALIGCAMAHRGLRRLRAA